MTDAISGTTATTGTSTYATATRTPKQEMDSEMFLQLLVTQLKYQDPSSPMDSSVMMQQTTQLASMEALNKLTASSETSLALQQQIAAMGLVGKSVSYLDASGATVTGIAAGVSFASSVPTVSVDGVDVSLSAISALKTA